MYITNNEEKIKIVEDLLQSKSIDFKKALLLLSESVPTIAEPYPHTYPLDYPPTITYKQDIINVVPN